MCNQHYRGAETVSEQRKPAVEKGEKNRCKGPLRETKEVPDVDKFQATLQFHVQLLATWDNLNETFFPFDLMAESMV